MEPVFFQNSSEFRNWLSGNHLHQKEIFVGFYKVNSGKFNMSWSESVDVALCFGWIDGIRKSIDDESYSIRFTPRKPGSNWSNVNIKKVEELTKKGLMEPTGIAAFEKRTAAKSGIYSFENDTQILDPVYEQKFRENEKAWTFFNAMAPSYRKLAIHRIMSAKLESTRIKRLEEIIESCNNGTKIT